MRLILLAAKPTAVVLGFYACVRCAHSAGERIVRATAGLATVAIVLAGHEGPTFLATRTTSFWTTTRVCRGRRRSLPPLLLRRNPCWDRCSPSCSAGGAGSNLGDHSRLLRTPRPGRPVEIFCSFDLNNTFKKLPKFAIPPNPILNLLSFIYGFGSNICRPSLSSLNLVEYVSS